MAKKPAKKAAKKAPKKAAKKTRSKAPGLIEAAPTVGESRLEVRGLDEILGQSRAVGLLDDSITSGRVHHAWIFHGPEGVGKFTTALAFAAVLLDPDSAPGLTGAVRPDAASPVQRMLRAGTHPDLHIVRKELASSSRSDRVRGGKQTTLAKEVVEEFLIEPAARTRVLPGDSLAAKVFIVDEAHLLGNEAQNALLKTIEEPPEGTVVILVTPAEDRLLPTIRSRCQRVAFGTLPEAAMGEWIESSGASLGGIDAEWAFRFAGGSPGVLEAIIHSGLGRWHEAIEPALRSLESGRGVIDLGITLSGLVSDAAAEAVEGDARASKEVANRVAARRMFRLLGESFRAAARRGLEAGRPDMAEWAAECIGAVEEAEAQLNSNVALALVFEQLASECVSASGQP